METAETQITDLPFASAEDIEEISRNATGQLVVRVRGRAEPVVDVKVVRGFPWSKPGEYVGILTKDGKELALFKTLDGLRPEIRETLLAELRDKVFNPRILRLVDFQNEFGVTSIVADTDRGRVTFQIRSRDDVRVLSPVRALFRDADGNTYELADLSALDPASRKHMEQYF